MDGSLRRWACCRTSVRVGGEQGSGHILRAIGDEKISVELHTFTLWGVLLTERAT